MPYHSESCCVVIRLWFSWNLTFPANILTVGISNFSDSPNTPFLPVVICIHSMVNFIPGVEFMLSQFDVLKLEETLYPPVFRTLPSKLRTMISKPQTLSITWKLKRSFPSLKKTLRHFRNSSSMNHHDRSKYIETELVVVRLWTLIMTAMPTSNGIVHVQWLTQRHILYQCFLNDKIWW